MPEPQEARFQSEGIGIAYHDEGEGEPILLIHGFGSNLAVNWRSTGWIDTLKASGRRVVAFDNRGHGASGKLYDPALYRPGQMARDAANLMDHLEIGHADVMGYSMGGRIAVFLALERSERVRSLVIGGMGTALVEGMGGEERIASALEAPSLDAVSDGTGRIYRKFAEQTGADLAALAACIRGARETVSAERLARLSLPVLVAVGTRDKVAGSAKGLARLIPGAEALDIPDREHLPATGDKVFKAGVLEFLARLR
jgi:pimeloyl-ACP methyl ester carboxylesterase